MSKNLNVLPDGKNLPKVEVIVIDLSDEDGCKGFI